MSARTHGALTLALALLGTASTGCSIVNKPDRSQIQHAADAGSMDGGADAGSDAGADAGVDAEIVGDACARYQEQESYCDNGLDDDCDGLTDCADNAGCGSSPTCCGGTATPPEITSRWPDTALRWFPLARMPVVTIETMSDSITSFGTGEPQALMHSTCTPLVLGLRLTVSLTPQGCAASACNDSYAGIVFTGATGFPVMGPLLDDLRVAMRADGVVEITQNRAPIGSSRTAVTSTSPPAPIDVTVELSIGGGAAGNAAVFAEVTALAPGGLETDRLTILERTPVMPIGQLVRGTGFSGCETLAGLNLAVEGAGNGVHVGPLEFAQLHCANPSRFEPPTATIVSGTVHADSWSAGGIGAPALAAYRVSGTARYDLLFDATNRARSDEAFAPLAFAVGRATASDDIGPTWLGAGAPVRGDPLGCLPGDLTSPCVHSAREPTLLSLGVVLQGFVAHAQSTAVYELSAVQGSPSSFPLMDQGAPAVTAVSLDDAVDASGATLARCRSLRDPALVFTGPAVLDGSDTFWLFFTCEREGSASSDIRAVKLTSALTVDVTEPVVVVATPEQVGPQGELGVRGPEVVTQFLANVDDAWTEVSAFRVWFVATARSGRTTVWLTQAQGQPRSAPQFELYPINPVLTPSSDGVACEGRCTFGSLAVTRRVNELSELQFLLARSVDLPDGTRRFELLPMRQVVEKFWRAM